jgi:hypothetical protein
MSKEFFSWNQFLDYFKNHKFSEITESDDEKEEILKNN